MQTYCDFIQGYEIEYSPLKTTFNPTPASAVSQRLSFFCLLCEDNPVLPP